MSSDAVLKQDSNNCDEKKNETDNKESRLENIRLIINDTKKGLVNLPKLFSGDDTVGDVIRVVQDQVGRDDAQLLWNGKWLQNNQTLSSIRGIQGNKLENPPMKVEFAVRGGLEPSIPGPNVNDDKLVEKNWDKDAAPWRMHVPGLNIEFKHDGKKVIGQVGYPKGKFEPNKRYDEAYCPHFGVSCPKMKAITNYYFNKCKVHFEGKTEDGKKVDEEKEYPNKACSYSGGTIKYEYLIMTVTKN